MVSATLTRHMAVLAGLGTIVSPVMASAALAQPPGYDQGYDDQGSDQDDQTPPPGYDQAPPSGYNAPPPGYDQAPPPGYGQGYGAAPPSPARAGQMPSADYYGNGAPPPAQGYAPQGYGSPGYGSQGYPAQGYAGQSAPPPPPAGYDGSQPPPPPPGYQAGPDVARQADQDRQYAAYAQQWAQANCVKAHGDTGAGAVIGGAIGALLGSGLAGRHDRGAGALVGAGVGALGGAAVASSSDSGATSPGCPPGFVVRGGAPGFAYGGPAYVYAAPTWYRPWVFYGGVWTYRPYPYHVWYYNHYGWHRPYGYRGGPRGYRRRHW